MLPRFILLIALLCVACDGRPHGQADLYEVEHAMVLESADHGPELCLGLVLTSNPPQCGGLPVAGWSWDDVPGETATGGTTWGEYHLTGGYDGDEFAVVDAGPPLARSPAPDPDRLDTPCTEPAKGWAVPDPRRASEWDADHAGRRARDEHDFTGTWQDYYGDGEIVLNVAFTGELERHERDLRRWWGGALCVVERDLTYADLDALREEAAETLERDFGLRVLSSSTDESKGRVSVWVVSIDDAARAKLYSLFPEGAVRVESELTPVE